MRILLAALLFATAAEAAPVVTTALALPAVDLGDLPKPCVALGKQANAPRVQTALAARISLAQCLAAAHLDALKDLIDSQTSIEQVEDAMQPSFALLDTATASLDPAIAIAAQHAKGILYEAMSTRMLAAVPQLPASPSDDTMQLHNSRVAVLATWLQPWRGKAHDAYAAVLDVERANQGAVAKDAACRGMVADSKQRLAREPLTLPNS